LLATCTPTSSSDRLIHHVLVFSCTTRCVLTYRLSIYIMIMHEHIIILASVQHHRRRAYRCSSVAPTYNIEMFNYDLFMHMIIDSHRIWCLIAHQTSSLLNLYRICNTALDAPMITITPMIVSPMTDIEYCPVCSVCSRSYSGMIFMMYTRYLHVKTTSMSW
jgi:hypothetical protein